MTIKPWEVYSILENNYKNTLEMIPDDLKANFRRRSSGPPTSMNMPGRFLWLSSLKMKSLCRKSRTG